VAVNLIKLAIEAGGLKSSDGIVQKAKLNKIEIPKLTSMHGRNPTFIDEVEQIFKKISSNGVSE
jgi:hypothetical protein